MAGLLAADCVLKHFVHWKQQGVIINFIKKFNWYLIFKYLGKKSNSKLPLKGHGQNKMDVLCFVSYKFSHLHTET